MSFLSSLKKKSNKIKAFVYLYKFLIIVYYCNNLFNLLLLTIVHYCNSWCKILLSLIFIVSWNKNSIKLYSCIIIIIIIVIDRYSNNSSRISCAKMIKLTWFKARGASRRKIKFNYMVKHVIKHETCSCHRASLRGECVQIYFVSGCWRRFSRCF